MTSRGCSRTDGQWTRAHDLFDRIRKKNLVADRDGNQTLAAQYCFMLEGFINHKVGEPLPTQIIMRPKKM